MKAVDFSRFSTGNAAVPVSVFRAIRSEYGQDMNLVIPGTWHGTARYSGARQSILNAREAGFEFSAAYTVVNMDSGQRSVLEAIDCLGDEFPKLSFLAIDVELETDEDIIQEAIDLTRERGVRPVIYTAYWAWHRFMRNTARFRDVPLWNAYYDNHPDVDYGRLPYGGWELKNLAGEQYTNTTSFHGYGFDFNYFSDDFVKGGVVGPVEHPLVQLRKAWEHDTADLAIGAASLIATPLDLTRLALYSLYVAERTSAWKRLVQEGGK